MGNIDHILNNKYSYSIITLFCFICYIANTYSNPIASYVMYSIYGLLILLLLIFSKNTYNSFVMLFFIPFTIGKVKFHEGTYSQIFSWFIPAIFVAIGIICHMFIYKPKLKIGKFSIGLMIYSLGLGLGGIGSIPADKYTIYYFEWYYPILLILGLILVNFCLIFYTSTIERSFESLIDASIYLTILLVLEIIFFMISNQYDPLYMIKEKALDLGWGIHNAVAMIFLTAMPLCIYRAFLDIKKYWYYLVYYVFLFGLLIFIVCKGGVLAAIIGTIVTFIGVMFFAKEHKKQIIYTFVGFISVVLIGLVTIILSHSDLAKHLNLGNWFSRKDIWHSSIEIFKKNPVFGIGLFGPCGWDVSTTFPHYQFAHNTILESMVITGSFGTICFLYHLVEKYTRVFYKFNFKKFIIFLFFLYPALYGLIDNTYLEITYMFYLLFALVVIDKDFEGEEIGWLLNFKKSKASKN